MSLVISDPPIVYDPRIVSDQETFGQTFSDTVRASDSMDPGSPDSVTASDLTCPRIFRISGIRSSTSLNRSDIFLKIIRPMRAPLLSPMESSLRARD